MINISGKFLEKSKMHYKLTVSVKTVINTTNYYS